MLNYSLAASNPKDCDFYNSLAASNTIDCVFYNSILRKIWLSPSKDLGSIIRHQRVTGTLAMPFENGLVRAVPTTTPVKKAKPNPVWTFLANQLIWSLLIFEFF